jgi:hypothetical protein
MIFQIFMAISLLVGIYFYMYKYKPLIEEPMKNIKQEHFIPSNSFIGEKKGYVFKRCANGLGYYLDVNKFSTSS